MEDLRNKRWLTGSELQTARQAAAFITDRAYRAVNSRGRFTLVLAGGSTPIPLYAMLARGIPSDFMSHLGFALPSRARRSPVDPELVTLPWQDTLLFQGDERHVPWTNPDSNYGTAREHLIRHICIPPQNLMPMPVGETCAAEDARRYEKQLRSLFRMPEDAPQKEFPAFDLVILGLGDDGHTASLFPGDREALAETRRWVVAVDAPEANPPLPRLTLTLPVINHAETVMFMVPAKRIGLARSIMEGKRPDLPAGMVKPVNGAPVWFAADTGA